MKRINIGFGNMVSASRLITIVSPESAPIKRIIQDARDNGVLIFVAGICGFFSVDPSACHTLGFVIMILSLASLVYAVVMQKTFDFNIANQFLLSWLFMLCV